MARSRNIKPGFFKNEDLAECSPWARLCFAGLWLLADREGRLEDRPKRIKAELFAFDAFDVEPLLVELERRRFIVRYEIDGSRFIQVSKFLEHQTPHYSEKPSVIKPPPLQESKRDEAAVDSKKPPRVEHPSRGGQNPLIPDSLIPDSPPTPRRGRGAAGVHEFPPGFEALWAEYPRKAAKDAAAKAFAKLRPDEPLQATLIAAVKRQRDTADWRKDGGRFVPHLASWLNGRRWEDDGGAAPGGDIFAGAL